MVAYLEVKNWLRVNDLIRILSLAAMRGSVVISLLLIKKSMERSRVSQVNKI